ncbi:MAG: putative porin [Chitinophagaceae bacterium]
MDFDGSCENTQKIQTLLTRLIYIFFCGLLFVSSDTFAQRSLIRSGAGRLGQLGRNMSGGGGGGDSLTRRDKFEDSITIHFRYLDSTRNFDLDSSVSDYTRVFPIPATNIWLGNTGNASRSILFSPIMQAGWDPGFHSYDIYRYSVERVRFFNTTRPYSELSYQLASRSEQIIQVLHTQNIKPNWNFLFQYRLINAPGFFKNQRSNHNNYLLSSWYQGVKKRYNLYLIVDGNKIQAGENGGLTSPDSLNFSGFKERFRMTTRLGDNSIGNIDFFNTDVGTGNRYSDFTTVVRQQYDFGRKDSLVTDSTVIPLFYPRVRLEYTVNYSIRKYDFRDRSIDTAYYHDFYQIQLAPRDTFHLRDAWREILNDFSIYTFPDANNLQQFLKVGAAVQNLTLTNAKGDFRYFNIYGHAEYRNRTRDRKWDLEANGKLYFAGFNAGDYQAYASLQRFIGKRRGYVQLGFENVNREPSFIFNQRSDFFLDTNVNQSFNKENTVHLFASIFQPFLQLRLTGNYYLVTNYTYLKNFIELSQQSSPFNVLQISAEKVVSLGKRWKWHADVYFQQVLGNAEVNLPTVFTRNRIGYEGNLGFKNLDIAFGAEFRYHTGYQADGYSPLIGKFQFQDTMTIKNKLPDLAGYVQFRIKGFRLFFRAENLNTAQITSEDGFGWTRNNAAAPNYFYPGFLLRFGVYWTFVN